VTGFAGMYDKVRPLVERLDGFSIRERALIFGVGVALLYVAWQSLLMDPLTVRGKAAEQHLADAQRQMTMSEQIRAAVVQDPAVEAALRNGALAARLAALDLNLSSVAHGYVAPERMTELLRSLLSEQRGLTLVSLANLPVESLSLPSVSKQAAASTPAAIAPDDRGPFLHPVEMVVEGDYGSVVVYLRALEALPWRIHWQRVELTAGDYPVNRVRIVIGALSLSRYWMSV
jgi:MSHA biogenesis protein MshJ